MRWRTWLRLNRRDSENNAMVLDAAKLEVLDEVRLALRLGLFEHLDGTLLGQSWAQMNADCLNVLGVASELQGQWKSARRYYIRAVRCNPRYEPARRNMRRMYELETFGRSNVPVALGDERPALGELLSALDRD